VILRASIALLLLAFVEDAHAQSFFERWGINAFFGVSPSTQDFVTGVGHAEILQAEIAKLVDERGSERTKQFVSKMLREHRDASAHLTGLVSGGDVRVSYPTTLTGGYKNKFDRLKYLGGAEFEREFDRVQVALHKDMVSLFERYGRGGSHPDLKRFAFRYLPHVLDHWRRAKEQN
jgi:putative membrane protein